MIGNVEAKKEVHRVLFKPVCECVTVVTPYRCQEFFVLNERKDVSSDLLCYYQQKVTQDRVSSVSTFPIGPVVMLLDSDRDAVTFL
jgi:hypothetical protein